MRGADVGRDMCVYVCAGRAGDLLDSTVASFVPPARATPPLSFRFGRHKKVRHIQGEKGVCVPDAFRKPSSRASSPPSPANETYDGLWVQRLDVAAKSAGSAEHWCERKCRGTVIFIPTEVYGKRKTVRGVRGR